MPSIVLESFFKQRASNAFSTLRKHFLAGVVSGMLSLCPGPTSVKAEDDGAGSPTAQTQLGPEASQPSSVLQEGDETPRPLTLSEFKPLPRLKANRTAITHAKFPVVDVHTHFAIRIQSDPLLRDQYLQTMDRNNIAISVSLDGPLGVQLASHCEFLWAKYPDRFVVFANIPALQTSSTGLSKIKALAEKNVPGLDLDSSRDFDAPEFLTSTVESMRAAKSEGVSGLKFFKQFGLGYRHRNGNLVAIDDPRWDPIWEACARLNLPVIMHTGDPSAFFTKIDANNERYEELSRRPEWSFYGKDFPSRQSLHEARNRVIARHPQTVFIAAHFGNDAEDLDETGRWLDSYPNLFVEFASRISELGRQPRRAREFFDKYQDRILFGTDGPFTEERLQAYWRFLETADEYFPYSEKSPPPQGLWNIYGLSLPDEILRKVYHENASRIIPGVAERLQRVIQATETNAGP